MRAIRITYVGELGWELYIPVESAAAVYDALVEAGLDLGLRDAGYYALDSLRLEKGYRAWGHDVTPDDTPLEAGLEFAVRLDKPSGFIGRDALVAQKDRGIDKRLVIFTLEDVDARPWGDEPILARRRARRGGDVRRLRPHARPPGGHGIRPECRRRGRSASSSPAPTRSRSPATASARRRTCARPTTQPARERARDTNPSQGELRMRTVHASVCPLDCPDTCSLAVAVLDDQIVEVRGSRANPYTAGVICAKVARDFPPIANGEGRLLTPLARVGARGEGRFRRVSWEEALDQIHARFTSVMAAHGPQAILPLNYAGPHGMLAGGSMDLRFFHKLGATILDRKPLCGGIRSEAWLGTFGAVPGIPPEQVALSKLIVAWGNNVTWSNLHLMPVINAARRHGAKLVVVDPTRTKVAEQADLHVAVRPGADVVLAWALTNELERLGALDRAFIEQHVQGFDSYMERVRRITLADAERITGVPGRQIQDLAELVPQALAGRDQRGQRARAESERR